MCRKGRPSARDRQSSSTSSPMCPNGGCPRSWPSPIASVRSSFSRSARDGARDPGRLERVREPRAVVVALGRDEHLRLVLQPERLGVHDPVAIPLERGAVLGVRPAPRERRGKASARGQRLPIRLLQMLHPLTERGGRAEGGTAHHAVDSLRPCLSPLEGRRPLVELVDSRKRSSSSSRYRQLTSKRLYALSSAESGSSRPATRWARCSRMRTEPGMIAARCAGPAALQSEQSVSARGCRIVAPHWRRAASWSPSPGTRSRSRRRRAATHRAAPSSGPLRATVSGGGGEPRAAGASVAPGAATTLLSNSVRAGPRPSPGLRSWHSPSEASGTW